MLNVSRVSPTVNIKVLVQFRNEDGTVYQGDFTGRFKRLPNKEIDDMLDAEPPMLNSEIVEQVLESVTGIGDAEGKELPAEEQLAWVRNSAECVNAAVAAFFKELRPERYNEKTSGRRRGRG